MGEKFIAAVKVLINDGKGNIVLIKRLGNPDIGTWDAPGGSLEVGETFEQCGVREVKEETGLDVSVTSLIDVQEVFNAKIQSRALLFYYWGKLLGGRLAAADDAGEAKWISLEKIRTQEGLRPAFVKILEKVIS